MNISKEKAIIIAHTGVFGKENRSVYQDRKKIVKKCVLDAWKSALFLKQTENACVDAVEKSISILENSGIVNAGVGSVKQKDGIQRMDASIMRGVDLEFGAVCSLRGIRNPISVARIILDQEDGHNMYAHDFAQLIAMKYGIDKLENPSLLNSLKESQATNQISKNEHNENKKNRSYPYRPPGDECETVGAVAIDNMKRLCAGTSTGGFGKSHPGRIGDSCIIGAGCYCNQKAAVSLTGRGENIIKLGVGKRIVDLISHYNKNIQESVGIAISEYAAHFSEEKHTIGVIAIDNSGNYCVEYKGAAMVWAGLFLYNDQLIIKYASTRDDVESHIVTF